MTDNTAKKYDSTDFQESNFGIRNKEDMKHIFDVMRNKIYSNKILAVLREYSTNACDAHIESGQKNRPIEVTLPTQKEPVLRIRDFGAGLSEEDIRNIYTMYGASTKRGSSELNGQLGFGSKAAFSYIDNYTVISYFNGQKTTYEAYVDETGLGAISQISKEDTLEPSGIEIQVSVQYQDIDTFHETASKLYEYFEVPPRVKNINRAITRPTYKLKGTSWGLREQEIANNSNGYYYSSRYRAVRDFNKLIMGNVAYPVNYQVLQDNLKSSTNWRLYDALLNSPVDFFVPVGKASIAASREALEYNKNTLRAFQELFNTAIEEITAEFNRRLAVAKDIVEAKRLFSLITKGELKSLAGIITSGQGLMWNGQLIEDEHFRTPLITYQTVEADGTSEDNLSYTTRLIEPTRYNATGIRQYTVNAHYSFEFNNEIALFYQDTSDKPILRIRKYLADNSATKKRVLLFKVEEGRTTIDQIATESTIPRSYFTNLSTIEPLVVENTRAAGPHNVKHSRKVFQLSPLENSRGADSTYWDTVSIDPDQEYYYVYLSRFCPQFTQDASTMQNHTFNDLLTNYQRLTGTDIRSRIIGVKVGAADRIAPTWRSLHSVLQAGIEQQITTLTADIRTYALADLRLSSNGGDIIYKLHEANFHRELDRLDPQSPMRQFYSRFYEASQQVENHEAENSIDLIRSMTRLISSETLATLENLHETVTNEITNEFDALINNHYPLLEYINLRYGQTITPNFAAIVADYIIGRDLLRNQVVNPD